MNNTPVLKICYLLSIPYACQIIMLDSIRSLFRTQLETCNRRPDLKTSSESPQSMSMGRYFRTSLRHQIRTSSGQQIGTSPLWSNRMFRGRCGDVGQGRPRDVLGTNICRLGYIVYI